MIILGVDINVEYASKLSINQFEREFRCLFGKFVNVAYNEVLKHKKHEPIIDNIEVEESEAVVEIKSDIREKRGSKFHRKS
jgi:hypothetical protein